MKTATRFPPSPTGYFHIGSARTALFNYLFARHEEGTMHLRFEDTDKERSKPEYEADIVEGLKWLGLAYEKPEFARQSERTAIYKGHLKTLIESGAAYEAEAGKDAPDKKVVRFKNPNIRITFNDLVRGEVSFDTTELKDFVIAKNIDEPLYHLAVVIDDREMGISHVIRGEDHISNTPRQILILEALGFTRPQYAHIPLILAPDRSKLSKRHGAVSVNEFRAMGFVPEAFVNYLALLGWNPGGEQEVFSMDELVTLFSLEKVHKGGAIFDIEKLLWLNHQHLKQLTDEEYERRLRDFASLRAAAVPVHLLKERARTLKEAAELLENGEFAFLDDSITYDPALLLKGAKTDARTAERHLAVIVKMLGELGANPTAEGVKGALLPYATAEGRAQVLWPLRVALSGREKSPDPFVIISLIGAEKALTRIDTALKTLSAL